VTHRRTKHARAPRVGDTVLFDFAGSETRGVVVEDRGPLGTGGQHLYDVRIDMPYGADPMFIELPVSSLTIAKRVA
jgi:hypothetical protein